MKNYIEQLESKHTRSMQESILQPKKKKLVIVMWSWLCDTLNQPGRP